jgi:hypothetical protein
MTQVQGRLAHAVAGIVVTLCYWQFVGGVGIVVPDIDIIIGLGPIGLALIPGS